MALALPSLKHTAYAFSPVSTEYTLLIKYQVEAPNPSVLTVEERVDQPVLKRYKLTGVDRSSTPVEPLKWTSPRPLTKINLQLLQHQVMGTPFTPGPCRKTASTTSKSTSSSAKPDRTINDFRNALKRSNLLIDDDDALERCPYVLPQAQGIVNAERESTMKPESQKRFARAQRTMETANEDTGLSRFLDEMLHKERQVRKDLSKDTSLSTDASVIWEPVYWDKDHLTYRRNHFFLAESVPPLQSVDPLAMALQQEFPKLKTPKPDITYALDSTAFDEKENYLNDYYAQYACISSGVYYPFFLIECKSSAGSIEDATTQACRGGAALVHAMRQMATLASSPTVTTANTALKASITAPTNSHPLTPGEIDTMSSEPSPPADTATNTDLTTPLTATADSSIYAATVKSNNAASPIDPTQFAFTLALTPSGAQIYVHWAEEGHSGSALKYHMHLVEPYTLKRQKDVQDLRRAIDNILDWGVLTRKTAVKQLLARVRTKMEADMAAAEVEMNELAAAAAAAERNNPSPSKRKSASPSKRKFGDTQ